MTFRAPWLWAILPCAITAGVGFGIGHHGCVLRSRTASNSHRIRIPFRPKFVPVLLNRANFRKRDLGFDSQRIAFVGQLIKPHSDWTPN